MTKPTKKAKKRAGPPEHSPEAVQAHPAPDREDYATPDAYAAATPDAYAAACKRVNEARVLVDKKLTPKQQRFVEEYLVDCNATQAAIRAGYSEKTAKAIGSENLTKPDVAAAIAKATKKVSGIVGLSVERTLKEVARLAYADVRNLYDSAGNLIPVHQLDDDTAATVASIEVEEEFSGKGESRALTGHLRKVKTHDKRAALDMAMKYHGMYIERHEHTVTHSYADRLEKAKERVSKHRK